MEDQDRGFRRGRGGRRRERGFRERPSRGKGDGPMGAHAASPTVPPMKTPIILTKPSADRGQETPVKQILIKPREQLPEASVSSSAPQPATSRGKTILSDHSAGQGTERSTSTATALSMGGATGGPVSGTSASVDALATNMASLKLGLHSHDGAPQVLKLLDENLQWNDAALEMLLDQTDFLVVGVIGPQGVGKSTLLSVLGGAGPFTDSRSCLFPVQSRQVQEDGTNQSTGIDLAVTQERVILLDTQPLLSAALLDRLIHHDRNIPPEYTSPENYNEIQSLQIVTFLLTVCHVILVVQDWFTDLTILRLLKTAEMLKPSSTSHTSHESSGLGSSDESDENYPNIVFVYNKGTREDFHHENLSSMHYATSTLFQHSRLKLQTGISLLSSSLMPYRTLLTSCDDMNIFVVPVFQPHGGNGMCTKSPTYQGHPSFDVVLHSLRNQVFSVHRHLLTHHSLTERNWFHFAARSWETVRKSSLISEYNRLLCSQ